MKFIETITFMGNDVLVPIKKIEYIMMRANEKGYEITIKGRHEFEWVEHFADHKKALVRYKMIMKIIKAA